jgi:tripartite-type tricarboxylate transporter receptor subunit TctC
VKLNRRAALAGVAAVGAAPKAFAQAFPSKPIKIVVPFAAGSATDLTARGLGAKLQEILKQPIIVDDRPGASGQLGASAVATAPADGYTLMMGTNTTNAANSALFKQLSYDPEKDFAPIMRCVTGVNALVVNNDLPVKTVAELVDYAKKNPGKLAYGSAGLGTSSHLRLEMLKVKAGIDILHVPYRGNADALNDILANNVQMMNEINPMPHVKAGKLILLDISYPERHPNFPGVPTLFEVGYGDAYVPSWYSIWAPAGTPREIIDKLNAKMVEIAKTPEMKARLLAINVAFTPQTPDEMGRHLAEDTKRVAELIRLTNLKLE